MRVSRLVGYQFVQKVTQKTFCLHAMKPVYRMPVAVGNHRGETFGLVPACNPHVFVGINFGQNELPGALDGQALQQRRQHEAWAAPVCANVEHHRHRLRSFNDQRLKIRFFDIKDKFHSA
jgi:hypothetical protein